MEIEFEDCGFGFDRKEKKLLCNYDTNFVHILLMKQIIQDMSKKYSLDYLDNNPEIVWEKYKSCSNNIIRVTNEQR